MEKNDLPRWNRMIKCLTDKNKDKPNGAKEVKRNERKYHNCRRKHRDL